MLPRSQKPDFSCNDCELGPAAKGKGNCVSGEGRRGKIMIIGERMNETDIVREKVFRGRHGKKLDYLLERAGLRRKSCYLTNAIKCRLAKGKKPKKAHKVACRLHLFEEIQWVKPSVIITLGPTPLELLAPGQGTAKQARGFPIKFGFEDYKAWLLPATSIDMTLGSAEYDPVFVRDLKLAKEIVANPGWARPDCGFTSNIVTTVEGVRELADWLIEQPQWAFDLETNGFDFLNDAILCVSFATSDGVGHVIPVDKGWDGGSWTENERTWVIRQLRRIFMSQARKTAQNGKFDLKFLRRLGIKVRGFDFDTMVAHHLVEGSAPEHNLDFIAQWYGIIHERYSKKIDEQKKKHKTDKYMAFDATPLFHYAGLDAAVTEACRTVLEPLLDEKGVRRIFDTVSMPQTMLLMHMEYYGAHLDRPEMNILLLRVQTELDEVTKEIQRILKVPTFNPRSTTQLKNYFNKKRIKLDKETATGGKSVDEEVLSDLERQGKGGDIPGLVLKMRSLNKLEGTYLKSRDGKKGLMPKLDTDNYLHTNFNITGTYTGRLSSNGPNLQNIPRGNGIRELFIPDEPGDEFLGADYRQLEVRVAAGVSKDIVLIKEIRDGVDMHSRNAATFLLKMDEDEFRSIIKDETHEHYSAFNQKRSLAKAVTFGVLYGSSAYGVSSREKIPLQECEKFIKRFFRKYGALSEWIKGQHRIVRANHKVTTKTGRFYHFPDFEFINSRYCATEERRRRMGDIERIACNMPIQGYGSDIFQARKLRVFKYLIKNKMKSRLVLSLHDGFLLNTKPDEKEELQEMVPRIMNTTLNTGTRYEVPLDVDMEFTDRWHGK